MSANITTRLLVSGSPTDWEEIIVFVLLALATTLLIFKAICVGKKIIQKRRQKLELECLSHKLLDTEQIEMFDPDTPLDDPSELVPYDPRYEFTKERLKLGQTLGQGAFGQVVKAEAIGLEDGETSTTVAVKMLKERANVNQRRALIAELRILIHLGRHLNIVNLLGAVTKNLATKGELLVIVEYCKYGNLKRHLIANRDSFVNQLDAQTGHIGPSIEAPLGTRGYWGQSVHKPNKDKVVLTTRDLLCFAFQCARGMQYLAHRKIIHRDLAARNVLLAEDNIVKICDFGLAKDVYKCDNYVINKKTDGPLPIKWLAIETLRDKVFTLKSDVWSFGILLYEFFTLGGNPYPGIEIGKAFYLLLKSGYRMERPDLAPNEIYELMKQCWNAEPKDRPDFIAIADIIGALMESNVRQHYLDLNDPYQQINEQILNNKSDYLQMSSTMTSPRNEINGDYLRMPSEEQNTERKSVPVKNYDNSDHIQPIDGNIELLIEPLENVPMAIIG